jgi:hypothetical protein
VTVDDRGRVFPVVVVARIDGFRSLHGLPRVHRTVPQAPGAIKTSASVRSAAASRKLLPNRTSGQHHPLDSSMERTSR